MSWPKQRSWGWYATLIRTPWFCLKLLRFKSYGVLSMQRHFYRAELWTILKGKGLMVGNPSKELSWLEGAHVPKNTWHQFIANIKPVYIFEIQYGKKVTESDIERK